MLNSFYSTTTIILLPPHTPHLLPNRQKQPIAHITQTRLQHALGRQLSVIHPRDPNFDTLGPLGGGAFHSRCGAEDGQNDDTVGAPLAKGLDGGGAGAARSNDGVEDQRQAGGLFVVRGVDVVGEVVVVFYGLERGGFAVQTEVVDGDGVGEEGLDRCLLFPVLFASSFFFLPSLPCPFF